MSSLRLRREISVKTVLEARSALLQPREGILPAHSVQQARSRLQLECLARRIVCCVAEGRSATWRGLPWRHPAGCARLGRGRQLLVRTRRLCVCRVQWARTALQKAQLHRQRVCSALKGRGVTRPGRHLRVYAFRARLAPGHPTWGRGACQLAPYVVQVHSLRSLGRHQLARALSVRSERTDTPLVAQCLATVHCVLQARTVVIPVRRRLQHVLHAPPEPSSPKQEGLPRVCVSPVLWVHSLRRTGLLRARSALQGRTVRSNGSQASPLRACCAHLGRFLRGTGAQRAGCAHLARSWGFLVPTSMRACLVLRERTAQLLVRLSV